jgi:hypothetical protein
MSRNSTKYFLFGKGIVPFFPTMPGTPVAARLEGTAGGLQGEQEGTDSLRAPGGGYFLIGI